MVSFTINAFTPFALAQVPLEGQSGVIERSLRQSLPQELPPIPKAPKVSNKSKPSPSKASAAGPTFFIKKIKLTGNTVAFAELLFAIDQNITKIYGSYGEMQDHLLWMYKLFRDSFPRQEQFLEVDRQPQPNQVKLRKIKTNTKKNNASEGKRL